MRTRITILGMLVALAATSLGTANAVGLSGPHGCVATAGDSCTFVGDPSGVPSGAASGTTGSYTVSHAGTSGTVIDISSSGPGAIPYVFTNGVLYTLTVDADGSGAVTAGSPEPMNTPIRFVCAGTAGYEQTSQGPRWKARQHDGVPVVLPTICFAYAPDTAKPFTMPDPPPQVDPTNPVGAYSKLYGWAYRTAYGLDQSSSVSRIAYLYLSGVGDFACGAGTLTDDGDNYQYSNALWTWHGGLAGLWSPDWTATFASGVGQITGTATGPYGGAPWFPASQQRTLSGTIVVDDGAAYGQCDDSAGASQFVAVLTLS